MLNAGLQECCDKLKDLHLYDFINTMEDKHWHKIGCKNSTLSGHKQHQDMNAILFFLSKTTPGATTLAIIIIAFAGKKSFCAHQTFGAHHFAGKSYYYYRPPLLSASICIDIARCLRESPAASASFNSACNSCSFDSFSTAFSCFVGFFLVAIYEVNTVACSNAEVQPVDNCTNCKR